MGIAFKDLIAAREIAISELQNKVLAVDTFNMLYQFLTTIRSSDGSLLTDQHGNVTSHLVGMFSRVTSLMQKNIKPIFVFDGKPPKLKLEERQRRKEIKQQAQKDYEIAKSREDIASMKKYASRTAVLTKDMIDDAKQLIACLGLPIVQAPSEGEAQAAYIVKKGDAYATVSQDFDTLLYATPLLVRNLSIAGRRKVPNKPVYETVNPEIINLKENLANLKITQDQLIAMAILIGTDYNKGGIKGIGPKHALKFVNEYKELDELFKQAKWDEHYDFSWQEIFSLIKEMPVEDDYSTAFKKINQEKTMDFLCNKHNFEAQRVENTLNKTFEAMEQGAQIGLTQFFKK